MQMLPHISIQYQEHTFVNTTTDPEAPERCQTHSDRYKISKILIFAWKLKFVISDKYC